MKIHVPKRLILAIVVVIGASIPFGFFSIASRLSALQQPVLSRREGYETRAVPMPLAALKPGTVIGGDDIGTGQWPVRQLQNDMILSRELIIGRVVRKEIPASTPVSSSSLGELKNAEMK